MARAEQTHGDGEPGLAPRRGRDARVIRAIGRRRGGRAVHRRTAGRHQRALGRRQEPGQRSSSRTSATTASTTCRRTCSTASWRCATPTRLAIDTSRWCSTSAPATRRPPIKQARAALAARGIGHAGPLPGGERRGRWSAASARRATAIRCRRAAACRPGSREERERLARTRELADQVIDTSSLSIGQLKEQLIALLPRDGAGRCGPDRHPHLRLQVRHSDRGRPRLRRPLPDQSVLRARPQAALRAAGPPVREFVLGAADGGAASSTWSSSCWS